MNREYQKREEQWTYDQEGDELIGLVRATGEWLERLTLKPNAVNAAMGALRKELENPGVSAHPDWRQEWEGFFDCDLKSTELFIELNGYAFLGVWPHPELFVERGDGQSDLDLIAGVVGLARSFVDSIPAGWGSPQDLINTVVAAEARLAIDAGEDVTTVQLAALSRLSLKSIKNLVAPGNSAETIKLSAEGKISSSDAKRWLEGRDKFQPSIWRLRETEDQETTNEPLKEVMEPEDVLFVPAARDGSIFDPILCRRADGYTIGLKGEEEKEPDYLTALQKLTLMSSPHWRRPNTLGNWGTVIGDSWVRKTRSELGLTDGPEKGAA